MAAIEREELATLLASGAERSGSRIPSLGDDALGEVEASLVGLSGELVDGGSASAVLEGDASQPGAKES